MCMGGAEGNIEENILFIDFIYSNCYSPKGYIR